MDILHELRAIDEAWMYESPASTKRVIDTAIAEIEQLRAQLAARDREIAAMIVRRAEKWETPLYEMNELARECREIADAIERGDYRDDKIRLAEAALQYAAIDIARGDYRKEKGGE